MKTFKFVILTGYPKAYYETEEAFEDDVTEKELEECLWQFIFEHIEGYWEEVKE
jgi:hypothetical protein